MLLLVVSNDTFGYLVGASSGSTRWPRRSAPRSPGKASPVRSAGPCSSASWPVFLLDLPWWFGVVLAVAMVAAATAGDLAESMVKRELGIKDMSNILPGHGGVMDRLDSIVFAAPVAYLWLLLAPGRSRRGVAPEPRRSSDIDWAPQTSGTLEAEQASQDTMVASEPLKPADHCPVRPRGTAGQFGYNASQVDALPRAGPGVLRQRRPDDVPVTSRDVRAMTFDPAKGGYDAARRGRRAGPPGGRLRPAGTRRADQARGRGSLAAAVRPARPRCCAAACTAPTENASAAPAKRNAPSYNIEDVDASAWN